MTEKEQDVSPSVQPAVVHDIQNALLETQDHKSLEENNGVEASQLETLQPTTCQSNEDPVRQIPMTNTPESFEAPLPHIMRCTVEDETVSSYDYTPYEIEPHMKRNQNVLGLNFVWKTHALVRDRHPVLPQYPDHIDKVWGEFYFWIDTPTPELRNEQYQSIDNGGTAFSRFHHRRVRLPNLDERQQWVAQHQDGHQGSSSAKQDMEHKGHAAKSGPSSSGKEKE